MKVTEYLERSKWPSYLISIMLLFLIFFAMEIGLPSFYYRFVDWFAVFGFSFLYHFSQKQGKILSQYFFASLAILFFTGMDGLSQRNIFDHQVWVMIDSSSCTILITSYIYETTIKIMRNNHKKELNELYERNENLRNLLKNQK